MGLMDMINVDKSEYAEIEKDLKEASLIDADDELIDVEAADYWEQFLCFQSQVRGHYYFTKKAMIFLGGIAANTQWKVNYKDIKKLEFCGIALFLPFGIRVHAYDEKKGKIKKYKTSFLKRKNRMEFLKEKTGLMM